MFPLISHYLPQGSRSSPSHRARRRSYDSGGLTTNQEMTKKQSMTCHINKYNILQISFQTYNLASVLYSYPHIQIEVIAHGMERKLLHSHRVPDLRSFHSHGSMRKKDIICIRDWVI